MFRPKPLGVFHQTPNHFSATAYFPKSKKKSATSATRASKYLIYNKFEVADFSNGDNTSATIITMNINTLSIRCRYCRRFKKIF